MAVLVAVASKYGATCGIADWDEIADWAAEIAKALGRHSWRSASAGPTRAPRRAGATVATMATA